MSPYTGHLSVNGICAVTFCPQKTKNSVRFGTVLEQMLLSQWHHLNEIPS